MGLAIFKYMYIWYWRVGIKGETECEDNKRGFLIFNSKTVAQSF